MQSSKYISENLIIGGLLPDEIKASKEDLMPWKILLIVFVLYAAANNRLENSKVMNLWKIDMSFLLVKLLTDDLKQDELWYNFERESSDGTSYEGKMFSNWKRVLSSTMIQNL